MQRSTTETLRGRVDAPVRPPTILVEFAHLSPEERAFVDLHTMRAVGTVLPEVPTDGVVIEFWLGEGDTVDAAYDDIRGWALGNGLPVRRIVGE
jgi:hypothetical protein